MNDRDKNVTRVLSTIFFLFSLITSGCSSGGGSSPVPVQGTGSLSGTVLGSPDPVSGATVTVINTLGTLDKNDDVTVATTTTSNKGFFSFTGLPLGTFEVKISGANVFDPLTGVRLPDKADLLFPAVPIGAGNNSLADTERPVFIPELAPGTELILDEPGTPVSTFQTDTRIANEDLGISLDFAASTIVTFPDPTKTTVSITKVPVNEIPMALPAGVLTSEIVTIQPAGATFNPPPRVTFPNPDGIPAGTTGVPMYRFDHDDGAWVLFDEGTVSADGQSVRGENRWANTSPNNVSTFDGTTVLQGLVEGGWHGATFPVFCTTTVVGRVVDAADNQGIAGAQVVTINALSGVTAADGSYSISSVPTPRANFGVITIASPTSIGSGFADANDSVPTTAVCGGTTTIPAIPITIVTPDTTPPMVSSVNRASSTAPTPLAGTGTVDRGEAFVLTFDEAVSPGSINATNLFLTEDATPLVKVPALFGINGAVVTFLPNTGNVGGLEASTNYTLTISGVQDLSGNKLAAPFIAKFKTAAQAGVASTITVSPATPAGLVLGTTDAAGNPVPRKFTASVLDGFANPVPGSVVNWSAAPPGIVAINAAGEAFPLATGTVAVKASVGSLESTPVSLPVTAPVVASVVVTPASLTMPLPADLAQGQQFKAVAKDGTVPTPKDIPGIKFDWTSGNAAVATVDAFGVVKAVSAGTTTITATAKGTTVSQASSVTFVAAAGIQSATVTPATKTVTAGETVRLTAKAFDATTPFPVEVTGVLFDWKSSDPTVATVSPFGVVTAVAVSTTPVTVTATAKPTVGTLNVVTQTAAITVDSNAVNTVTITSPTVTINELGGTQFAASSANVSGTPVPGQTFVWNSSDPTVASINSNGLAIGLSAGTTNITASTGAVTSAPTALTVSVDTVVANVVVSPLTGNTATIGADNTTRFKAVATNANGRILPPQPTFAWTSTANITVAPDATDSSIGIATGVSVNSATITATVTGGTVSGSATVFPDRVVATVTVTPATGSTATIAADNTTQLTAVARNAGGLTLSAGFIWSSGNTANATVNSATGLVTGVSANSASITATDPASAKFGSLTVLPDTTVASVVVTPLTETVAIGGNTSAFTGAAKNAQGFTISTAVFAWASSDPAVATIDTSTGIATGVAIGTANITATSGGVASATPAVLTVIPIPVASVVLPTAPTTVVAGSTVQFTAQAKDAAGSIISGASFTWASSNIAVATVNPSTGLVTGVAAGSANITATSGGTTSTPSALTVTTPPTPPLVVTVLGKVKATDPVQGVRILRQDPTTGAFLDEVTTDASGVANFGAIGTRTTITAVFGPSSNELFTLMNIQSGAITLTAPEGATPVATFSVQANNVPAGATGVNVRPLSFDGESDFNGGGLTGTSALIQGVEAFRTDSLGKFSTLTEANTFSGNVKTILGCSFSDNNTAATTSIPASDWITTNLKSILFNQPAGSTLQIGDVGVVSLRGEDLVDQFQGITPAASGSIQFCDDGGMTKYWFEGDALATPTNPTLVGGSVIKAAVPTGPITFTLPDISIVGLTRTAATQTLNWTLSGTDVANIDVAFAEFEWTNASGVEFGWEVLFDAGPNTAGTKSVKLPEFPANLSGSLPPASGVGFNLGYDGSSSATGYDAVITQLNQHNFLIDRAILELPADTTEFFAESGEQLVSLNLSGPGAGTIVTSSNPAAMTEINTVNGISTGLFRKGTDVTVTVTPDSISTVQSGFAGGSNLTINTTTSVGTMTFRVSFGGDIFVNFGQKTGVPLPDAIAVTPSGNTITGGATQQMTAVASNAGTPIAGVVQFNWTSSDTTVATVNRFTGLVTGVGNGQAVISATAGGAAGATITGSTNINVNVPVASVTVTAASSTVAAFGSSQMTAVAKDAGGLTIPGVAFNWSSDNTAIALVDATGLATGSNVGTANITAMASGTTISGSAALTVTALPANNMAVRVVGKVREFDPIQGARVILHDPATGAVMGDMTTDANGVANFGNIGMARGTLTLMDRDGDLSSLVNILAGAYTFTSGPGEGDPAQATFAVSVSTPTGTIATNLQVGHFVDSDGSFDLNNVQVFALKPNGKFDLFAFGSDVSANNVIVSCGFKDDLDPASVNGTTVSMTATTPSAVVPFVTDRAAVVDFTFLRDGSVFEAFGSNVGPSTSGNAEICSDAKVTKYDAIIGTKATTTTPTEVGIDLVFSAKPVAGELGTAATPILLPDINIDSVSRNAATQTMTWSSSGTDTGLIDLAYTELAWNVAGVEKEWFILADASSGSMTFPTLPVDPAGTLNPFPAMPPATMVGFGLGLLGLDTTAGTVGFDQAISLLNTGAFNFEKTFLTSMNRGIFVDRGETLVNLQVTGTGSGTVISTSAPTQTTQIDTANNQFSAVFPSGTSVTFTATNNNLNGFVSMSTCNGFQTGTGTVSMTFVMGVECDFFSVDFQ